MRELSSRELAFLKQTMPDGSAGEGGVTDAPRRTSASGSRLGQTLGMLLSYLPLAIGILTLIVASVAIYLYVWGRDFFKISEVERMSADGTIALMDSTSGGWFADTLQVFNLAPWIILGAVVLGIVLMALSMVLVGKRKNGQG